MRFRDEPYLFRLMIGLVLLAVFVIWASSS